MAIDNRTTGRNYPLPHPSNLLADDVQRLRDALNAIDADVVQLDQLIDDVIDGAPGALDTLNELAAALGDDANFAATVTTALNNRYTKAESDARYVQGVTQTENVFTGNGSQTTFTLSQTPPTRESLLVTVDGVVQPVSEYSLSGTALTLSEAPATGAKIRVLMLGVAGPVQSASTLNFAQAGTGAVTRTVDSKLKDWVSVKDFGAVGDGTTDDTQAFANAIATGKNVFVPKTQNGYVINNVPLTTNTVIVGEKSGVFDGPRLIISTSNAAAFVPANSNDAIFQCKLANFSVATLNTSVTNAAFYRHPNKTHYTAYFDFDDIETSTSLETSYDGFFIFTKWHGCRDGYVGNINTNTSHCAISSVPSSWSQGNQTNLNTVSSCHFFGDTTSSNNAAAIVDIGYGDLWTFQSCDFEGVKIPAARLRGVGSVAFKECWFERIAASSNVLIDITPSNAKGSGALFSGCYGLLTNTTSNFVNIGTASVANFEDCAFAQIPSGVVLATGIVRRIVGISASGVGSAGFLSGYSNNGQFYLNGLATANDGLLSRQNIAVTSSLTLISAKNSIYTLVFVSGYANGSGIQAWWLVAVGQTPAVIAQNDSTSTFPSFSEGAGGIYMKTTGGSLQVNVTTLG